MKPSSIAISCLPILGSCNNAGSAIEVMGDLMNIDRGDAGGNDSNPPINPVNEMRNMISNMTAVYAVDLGHQLGFFQHLAANSHPMKISDLLVRANCRCGEDVLMAWARAVQAVNIVEIDDDERVSLRQEWREALTDPSSTQYVGTLPRCYITLFGAFSRYPSIFSHGDKIDWQELGRTAIEDVSADSVRAANFFIMTVVEKVPGLRAKLEGKTIIYDVGCAAGHFTTRLARAFVNATIIGIDPWEEAIDLAEEHAREQGLGDRVKFKTLCATRIPPQTADIVIINDTLHEMKDDLRLPALRAICDSLKEGGGVFLSEPLIPSTGDDYRRENARIPALSLFSEIPFGAKIYTRTEIYELLRQSGFGSWLEIDSTDNDISVYATPK